MKIDVKNAANGLVLEWKLTAQYGSYSVKMEAVTLWILKAKEYLGIDILHNLQITEKQSFNI